MGALSIVEIFSNFAQATGIVASLSIPWPESLKWISQNLRILLFDFTAALPSFGIPSFDFRAQHLFLTNALPLALALVILILFKSIKVILLYFWLLMSTGIAISGLVLRYMPAGLLANQTALSGVLIIVGFSLLAFLVLGYIGWAALELYRKHRRAHEIKSVLPTEVVQASTAMADSQGSLVGTPAAQQTALRARSKPFLIQARNVTIGVTLVVVGLIATGAVDDSPFFRALVFYSTLSASLAQLGVIVGWLFVAAGSALLYNWILGNFKITRRFLARVNYLFRKHAIKVVLSLLTICYVPITSSLWKVIKCVRVVAPAGTEFVEEDVSLSVSSVFSVLLKNNVTGLAYTACNYRPETCPIAQKLCPQAEQYRLYTEMSISCTNEVFYYYWPGAAIMLLTITIGVPALFYKLVSVSANMVSRIPTRKNLTNQDRWRQQCMASSGCCASLYSSFEYKWKYYKLVTLVYKLLVVSVFVWAATTNSASVLIVATTANASMLLLSIVSRPYIRSLEDKFAIMCFLLNATNSALALSVSLGADVPTYLSPILVTANTACPLILLVIGIYLGIKERILEAKKENEREARMLEARTQNLQKDNNPSHKEANTTKGSPPGVITSAALECSNSTQQNTLSPTLSENKDTIVSARKEAELPGSVEHSQIKTEKTTVYVDKNTSLNPTTTLEINQEVKNGTKADIEEVENERKRKKERARKRKKQLLALIDDMDQELDHKLIQIMGTYFMILGIGAFLSLAVTAIGIMHAAMAVRTIPPTIVSTISKEKSFSSTTESSVLNATELEFGGANDWQTFTARCCCNMTQNNNVLSLETWKCIAPPSTSGPLFLYKQRQRIYNGDSGLALRPFCSPTFTIPLNIPVYNESLGLYTVAPKSLNTSVSDFAAKFLW